MSSHRSRAIVHVHCADAGADGGAVHHGQWGAAADGHVDASHCARPVSPLRLIGRGRLAPALLAENILQAHSYGCNN